MAQQVKDTCLVTCIGSLEPMERRKRTYSTKLSSATQLPPLTPTHMIIFRRWGGSSREVSLRCWDVNWVLDDEQRKQHVSEAWPRNPAPGTGQQSEAFIITHCVIPALGVSCLMTGCIEQFRGSVPASGGAPINWGPDKDFHVTALT